MIVNVGFVNVRTNNESVISLGEPLGKFITDSIRFLRCDFTGLEGLPKLICDDIILLIPSCVLSVFFLGKRKFRGDESRIAGIRRNETAVIGLLWIFGVIGSVRQALCQRFAFVQMQRNDSCCCHINLRIKRKKCGVVSPALRIEWMFRYP